MSLFNNEEDKVIYDIVEVVDIWLEGNIKKEYFCKVSHLQYMDIDMYMNMNAIKNKYYNLFLTELKKQTKMDNIEMIEKRLDGSLQVFFDEGGIIVCIVNEDYYIAGDSDDSHDDNYDY